MIASCESTSLAKREKNLGKIHGVGDYSCMSKCRSRDWDFLVVLKPQVPKLNRNPKFTLFPIL
jgi:hypothetical protein